MKRWIMVLVALLLLTACGTTTKPCALIREHGGVHDRVPVSSLPQRPGNPDLQYLQTAAALSAAVYVDVKHEIKLADVDPATLAKPEQSKNLALLPASGWEERTDIPRTQIPGKRQTPDLTYRLWVSTDTTKPRVAMWVFRGTHIPQDYISNLRWLTFWLGYEDHYQQTTRITEEMVKWIHREYGDDTVIFTAGHSLFRKVLGLKAHDPHIMEVKVHLFNGIFVKGHSMQQLASELAKGLNSTEPVTCSKD